MNETDFKKIFCDNVKEQGGYTFRIAASIMNGLPDIYCAMPGYVPVLLEAKWIKNISNSTFKRKIPYSAYQREILNNCNKVYFEYNTLVAFGLIGIQIENGMYCKLMNPQVEIITDKDIAFESFIYNKVIDIHTLFRGIVPLMRTNKYPDMVSEFWGTKSEVGT